VVAGVSVADGLLHYEIRPKSFNGDAFAAFLERLALKARRPLTVLLDNCRIHSTRAVKDVVRRCDIKLIFNVPYHPELNGIELVWAIAKKRFKDLQLQRLLGTLDASFVECIHRVLGQLTVEEVAKCCSNGLR
jgi:hypothetical protein